MKHVLIVDDEADVLWMLRKNLNKGMPDVETLAAASGEEALAVLASHSIDLVIVDIDMPGMSGHDLLAEINNKYPHAGVIIITACPSNTYQSQAILAGSLKFIEKPFDIKYLRKIVEEFFNNKKRGFQGTISGIDLIDIVQLNGLSRATAALKVTNDSSTGMIFFKDGQVVHAICDQMRGEEAFFTILAFPGGNLKNIKGVEAPVVTISKSIELLLLQATSIGDEVMEEQEAPFVIYEELEREPPPAFLSQREEEEKKSLLEEEPALFLDDTEAGETVAVLHEADVDGRPIAMPANKFSPIDSILAEFTAIDGVRLACLVGRNGFLLASQPEGNKSCKEAVSAIAASGLASTESMGEELARTSLQTGLFEYQDGTMILSPVGEDNFLLLVAEDGANLGWLRLVIRKNTSRIEKINT